LYPWRVSYFIVAGERGKEIWEEEGNFLPTRLGCVMERKGGINRKWY